MEKAGQRLMATQDYGWSQIAARAGLAWPEAVPWAMQRAVQAGFAAWEPFLKTSADARRIGQQAVDHGLAMPSIFVAGALFDVDQGAATSARIMEVVAEAVRFGCERVTIYPEPKQGSAKSDGELSLQAQNLNRLAEALSGVSLLYHPEEPEMADGAYEYHQVLTHTDPNLVRLCLDPDAIWRGAALSEPLKLDLVRQYADRTDAIHLRQSVNGVWAEVIGAGDMPLSDIAALTKEFNPHLVVEHAYEAGTPRTLDPVEAHRQSIAFARALFDNGGGNP